MIASTRITGGKKELKEEGRGGRKAKNLGLVRRSVGSGQWRGRALITRVERKGSGLLT